MIQVQQISRCYGDFKAVRDVSFSIERGEIVGLLGHNGAGKSTIMKMLTGYLEPSQGNIKIDGENLWNPEPLKAQEKIGYLPENCPVYPDMRVIDFLAYAASLRGLSGKDLDRALVQVIGQTELEEKATAAISTLSRGYRQRVGVAQALLNNPEIIILDEPTNGLDPAQIGHMRQLIGDLGQHATVIVSTHILQEVEAVCDRVLILRKGRLALDANLEELTRGRELLLKCSGAVDSVTSHLVSLGPVAAVEVVTTGNGLAQYRLSAHEDNANIAPVIAAAVVAQGWQLYELRREERTLEKVFQEISEQVEEVADAA